MPLGRRPIGTGRKVYFSVGLSPEAAEAYRRAAARMGVKARALVERAAEDAGECSCIGDLECSACLALRRK